MIVSVDNSAFQQAIRDLQMVSKKTMAEQLNQRAMNVARRCVETMPPHDVEGARAKVRAYMNELLSQRIRLAKSSKRFVKSGRKKNQLSRKNLIAQALNKKAGKKGLYGDSMRKASGKLSGMAQRSQGFLKSVFLPVIVGLYGVVKYRPPASLTNSISRWPGSLGHGKIKVAAEGVNPSALIHIDAKVRDDQESKVLGLYTKTIQGAIDAETTEMKAHLEREIDKELKKGF